jgi:hypothetical protein
MVIILITFMNIQGAYLNIEMLTGLQQWRSEM